MSLSRKHYREIASVLGVAKIRIENGQTEFAIDSVIDKLCDILKQDNKNFDRKIFKTFIEETYQDRARLRSLIEDKEMAS